MTDPQLARLRAVVEQLPRYEWLHADLRRGTVGRLVEDTNGNLIARAEVLALFDVLDAEAGEPEPQSDPQMAQSWNPAPPPSDACEGAMGEERRERLIGQLSIVLADTTHQTYHLGNFIDALFAAIEEELEPIAENLKATAINATDALHRAGTPEGKDGTG
jgi:hypothetical protein